jgi:hypothetical protein
MDTSGQAAEQMVRYSLEGMEYALKITGKGTERLAAALLALSQSQQKNKGKTTLNALLKSQKELKVFAVPENRLREFSQEAKRYGVLYCTLKEKSASPNALCDLLVKAEDAAKINRIIERMGLNQVAKTVDATADEPGVDQVTKEIENAEKLLHQILTVPEKENPTIAQTEKSSPSGHGSKLSAAGIDQRPSVRAALAEIRQAQSTLEPQDTPITERKER